MAQVLIVQSNGASVAFSANITSYGHLGSTIETGVETTEANANTPISVAGIFSLLYVRVVTNTVTATSTIRLRKNSANGNSAVSIGSSATGEFEDSSGTDAVAANDLVCFQRVIGATGTSVVVTVSSIVFSAESNTVNKIGLASSGGSSFSAASSYLKVNSISAADPTTESRNQVQVNHNFTWQHLYSYISANSRSTTTTIKSRVNGADGNQSLSITSSSTGAFEDTSNTDSVVTNDLIDFLISCAAGTGTITLQQVNSEAVSTDSKFTLVNGTSVTPSVNTGTNDDWYAIGGANGRVTTDANESHTTAQMNIGATVSNLWIYISNNTLSSATTLTLRSNSSDTSLSLSITASTTGSFENSSNTVSVAATDSLCIRLTENSVSGQSTLETISLLFTNTDITVSRIMLMGLGT